jgi:hypothetical protein
MAIKTASWIFLSAAGLGSNGLGQSKLVLDRNRRSVGEPPTNTCGLVLIRKRRSRNQVARELPFPPANARAVRFTTACAFDRSTASRNDA